MTPGHERYTSFRSPEGAIAKSDPSAVRFSPIQILTVSGAQEVIRYGTFQVGSGQQILNFVIGKAETAMRM